MNHPLALITSQRWQRPLIAGLATVGTLTILHPALIDALTQLTCSTGICTPPTHYPTLWSLPLPLFGILAYGLTLIFAIIPLLWPFSRRPLDRSRLNQITLWLLLASSTAAIVFSGYLMYFTAFQRHLLCWICFVLTLVSVSLFLLVIYLCQSTTLRQLLQITNVIGLVLLFSLWGIVIDIQKPGSAPLPNVTIPATSKPAVIELAKHLSQIEAKMYGAFWCSHCDEQKQAFGQVAWRLVNYIECDPQGQNPQADLCQAVNIRAFPTWEIKGQFYRGDQSLEKLADLSGYTGSRDF